MAHRAPPRATMHDQMQAAVDLMARHLGGPRGHDGRWRISGPTSGEAIEIYLQVDPFDRISVHVDSRLCPLKFAVITSLDQLDSLMKHLMTLCR